MDGIHKYNALDSKGRTLDRNHGGSDCRCYGADMPALSLPAFMAAHTESILIDIDGTKGSTPRDAGTFMLVSPTGIWGTIGGGQLEYMAIDNARLLLAGGGLATLDIPLGPEIGQCCGGRTLLSFRRLTASLADTLHRRLADERASHPHVTLFGAGHVGEALVKALSPLPFIVTVVETRADELKGLPDTVRARLTPLPEAEVTALPAGGAALVLTHDHALDFLIGRAALARTDLAYVGMIGSATKRATFAHWLKREGEDKALLERLVLPIGGTRVRDKRPAVIAALVAAELLTVYAELQQQRTSER